MEGGDTNIIMWKELVLKWVLVFSLGKLSD